MPIPYHIYEVLYKVEGSNIPACDWVGSSSLFGSIITVVKVHNKCKVHYTWVIKNNIFLFLMDVRYKKHMGHWVVIKATIANIPLFACAYAWRQHCYSYICISNRKYWLIPNFVPITVWRWVWLCWVERYSKIWICWLLLVLLPLVDQHNKQYQNISDLRRYWPPRNICIDFVLFIFVICIPMNPKKAFFQFKSVMLENYLVWSATCVPVPLPAPISF